MELKTFEEIYKINVNEKTEEKGGFTYLSWAWAWAEFKKARPDATYKIKKFGVEELPYIKTDEGFMVFTEITSGGETHEMWLPVMDFKNKAKKEADVMDINKTIMRCLVKNMAIFGLGLYIYAGEDLPEDEQKETKLENRPDKIENAIKNEPGLVRYRKAQKVYGVDFVKQVWNENKLGQSFTDEALDLLEILCKKSKEEIEINTNSYKGE